jgi:hypothetical protein
MGVGVSILPAGVEIRRRVGGLVALRPRISNQHIPVVYPRMVTRQHVGFHPVQIRQRVQTAGMDEWLGDECLTQSYGYDDQQKPPYAIR